MLDLGFGVGVVSCARIESMEGKWAIGVGLKGSEVCSTASFVAVVSQDLFEAWESSVSLLSAGGERASVFDGLKGSLVSGDLVTFLNVVFFLRYGDNCGPGVCPPLRVFRTDGIAGFLEVVSGFMNKKPPTGPAWGVSEC